MKVLVIGAAGRVGRTIRPQMEVDHDCRLMDLMPVPGAEERTIIAKVNDEDALLAAMTGVDAVVYLAMGYGNNSRLPPDKQWKDLDAAMDVNAKGFYRVLFLGCHLLKIKRYVYASTLSVYWNLIQYDRVDEDLPATNLEPYGMSKRLSEFTSQAFAARDPELTIVNLRLHSPWTPEIWPGNEYSENHCMDCGLGPLDQGRLFSAAVNCPTPGSHIVQASGDMANKRYPNTRVTRLLGWSPQNQ